MKKKSSLDDGKKQNFWLDSTCTLRESHPVRLKQGMIDSMIFFQVTKLTKSIRMRQGKEKLQARLLADCSE
jgi:hypothetical protein